MATVDNAIERKEAEMNILKEHTGSIDRAFDLAQTVARVRGAATISKNALGYTIQSVNATAARAIARMQGNAVSHSGVIVSVIFA
jgi:hypothetical protein